MCQRETHVHLGLVGSPAPNSLTARHAPGYSGAPVTPGKRGCATWHESRTIPSS